MADLFLIIQFFGPHNGVGELGQVVQPCNLPERGLCIYVQVRPNSQQNVHFVCAVQTPLLAKVQGQEFQ